MPWLQGGRLERGKHVTEKKEAIKRSVLGCAGLGRARERIGDDSSATVFCSSLLRFS